MKLLLLTMFALPCAVFAAEHDSTTASDAPPATAVPQDTTPAIRGSTPPTDAQGTAPDALDTPPEDMGVATPDDISMPEELAALHHETKNEHPHERFVLYIDALKYRFTTHNVEATRGRPRNETSFSSSTTTTTMQALDTTVGLKSYHNRLILGFGIASNIVSTSDAVSGGALLVGYQPLPGLEIGGLLYIAGRTKTTSTTREDVVDEQIFDSTEDSTATNSTHSIGPWLKLQAGDHWQAMFSVYYAASRTEQTSDSGQQTNDSQRNTVNKLTTIVERSYFALDLVFGPWIPLTEHLIFVPQINITCYLPRAYTQETSMSSSGGDTLSEDKLEFDEHSSFSYSLVLGGLRYEF